MALVPVFESFPHSSPHSVHHDNACLLQARHPSTNLLIFLAMADRVEAALGEIPPKMASACQQLILAILQCTLEGVKAV